MQHYPSDISRSQFRKIAPLLERARKKTRPRTYDLYDVFNGVLYLVRTGCQWRMIPKEYPPWESLHAYFRIWSEIPQGNKESILSLVLKKIGRGASYRQWQKTQNLIRHR